MTGSAELAHAVIDRLAAVGVRAIVGCPGSRNAELLRRAFALDLTGVVALHMRVDERTAGFTALGLAKASGRPVAVVVTSGTAVGNLLPAVMEARHQGVPLIVVSADRPASLRGTGANQTTSQPGMFANFASGLEVADLADVAGVVAAAGPVHVNVELDEPLLGAGVGGAVAPGDWVAPTPDPVELPAEPGTVLVVGDAPVAVGRAAAEAARVAGIPCLAEPSSNARFGGAIGTYRLLLETTLVDEVRRVVVVGRPTLSRPQRRLLTDPSREVIVVGGEANYHARVRHVPAVEFAPHDPAWLQRWQRADARVREVVDPLRRGFAAGVDEIVRAGVPGALVWGSSQLVRDVDLAPVPPTQPSTFANRGLAGIDGLIATASGIALASGSATLVLGDVSALHDLSSLVIPTLERVPNLRIVVANDDGGAIFATLEQGGDEFEGSFERVFAVPHGRSLAQIGAACGLEVREIRDVGELRDELAEASDGMRLVEWRGGRGDRRRDEFALREAVRGLDVS